MLRLSLRQRITALALVTALTTPWPSAAASPARQQPASPGFLQLLWTALTGFWDTGASLDDGCTWDPSGRRCAAGSIRLEPPVTPDAGCQWDPNGGHCAAGSVHPEPTLTPDEGCRWDPDGRCLLGS
jgi:hypothetical protein